MKWKRSESAYGAVVSDTPTGYDDPENVAAYGGYLVAESIPNHLAPLVAAAPELLEIVQGFVLNEKQLDDEHFKHLRDRLFAAAREVWLKAKGEST